MVHGRFQDVSEPDSLVRVASGKGYLHARLWFTRKVVLKVWLCEEYGDGSFGSKRNVLQGREMWRTRNAGTLSQIFVASLSGRSSFSGSFRCSFSGAKPIAMFMVVFACVNVRTPVV